LTTVLTLSAKTYAEFTEDAHGALYREGWRFESSQIDDGYQLVAVEVAEQVTGWTYWHFAIVAG
jgi:hypothetical protein